MINQPNKKAAVQPTEASRISSNQTRNLDAESKIRFKVDLADYY
jgi:hypothetical protein